MEASSRVSRRMRRARPAKLAEQQHEAESSSDLSAQPCLRARRQIYRIWSTMGLLLAGSVCVRRAFTSLATTGPP